MVMHDGREVTAENVDGYYEQTIFILDPKEPGGSRRVPLHSASPDEVRLEIDRAEKMVARFQARIDALKTYLPTH